MFRNLALLKLKHVKNMTVLDSSILRCHFGMRGLCRKAVIRSQKERSHLNYNKWPKKEEKDLEFGFCFYFSNYFFYIEWTSGKLKILFICCLYTPLVFWQTAVHDTCRSANDGRATSRSCDVSWVWLSSISRMTKVHKCLSRNLKRSVWGVSWCDFRFIWQAIVLNECYLVFHKINAKQHFLKQEKEKLPSKTCIFQLLIPDLVSEDRS